MTSPAAASPAVSPAAAAPASSPDGKVPPMDAAAKDDSDVWGDEAAVEEYMGKTALIACYKQESASQVLNNVT